MAHLANQNVSHPGAQRCDMKWLGYYTVMFSYSMQRRGEKATTLRLISYRCWRRACSLIRSYYRRADITAHFAPSEHYRVRDIIICAKTSGERVSSGV